MNIYTFINKLMELIEESIICSHYAAGLHYADALRKTALRELQWRSAA